MVLLFEQGNSRWKMSTVQGLAQGQVRVGANDDVTAFRHALADMTDGGASVRFASVARDEVAASYLRILDDSTQGDIRVVRSTDDMPGLRPGYHDNAQLGVDRVLAMIAARDRCRGGFCVIDAGTAITVDFVDADGLHLGGYILPGIRMARESLLASTAVPRAPGQQHDALLGRDTAAAIRLGSTHAVAGLVEHVFRAPDVDLGTPTPIVCIGGGDADSFLDLMPSPCIKIEHLVLQGLAVLAAG
jgi:type III pantothenate kinase